MDPICHECEAGSTVLALWVRFAGIPRWRHILDTPVKQQGGDEQNRQQDEGQAVGHKRTASQFIGGKGIDQQARADLHEKHPAPDEQIDGRDDPSDITIGKQAAHMGEYGRRKPGGQSQQDHCDCCNKDVRRGSISVHRKSKKHMLRSADMLLNKPLVPSAVAILTLEEETIVYTPLACR